MKTILLNETQKLRLLKNALSEAKNSSWIVTRFVLTAMGVLFLNLVSDLLNDRVIVALIELGAIFLLSISLYLNKKGLYKWGISLALVILNLLLFGLDSYIGIKGGTYLYYFPIFISIPFMVGFGKKGLMWFHLGFTLTCWAALEFTNHSLFLNFSTDDSVIRNMYLINLISTIVGTGVIVYFISRRFESLITARENEKLKVVLDSNRQLIMLLTPEGIIEMFNEKFQQYIKITHDKDLQAGTHFLSYFTVNNRSMLQNYLDRAIAGESFHEDRQVFVKNSLYWINVSFTPIFDETGKVKNVVFCGLNITKRKESERRLAEQNQSLTKVNEELDKMIYKISHDLRSPLASVLGLIEITQFADNQEEKQQYMAMMKSSVQRLDKMIMSLISLAKNTKSEIRKDKIHFEPFVSELFDSIRFAENAAGVSLEMNILQETEFVNDKVRLNAVLGNLLSNAIRYHNPAVLQPYVKIHVQVSEEKAVLQVSDNGIGIPAEHQSHIFEMFYKAGNNKNSSGLGLSIVKEAVSQMGGTISLQSEPGVGSTFEVILQNKKSVQESLKNSYQLELVG